MFETFLATLGVLFTPAITASFKMPGGLIASMVLGHGLNFMIIMIITVLTNIIRALRWCRDKKGNFKSFGLSYGIQKGLLCGTIAMAALAMTIFVPFLRLPFTIVSFIPGMSSLVDGAILAFFYLFSYMILAYPIWGAC